MRAVRVRVRAFVLIYVTLRFSCVVFLHCVWLVFTSIGGRLCTIRLCVRFVHFNVRCIGACTHVACCGKISIYAGVAELADAYASGAYEGSLVKVQVLSPAPFFMRCAYAYGFMRYPLLIIFLKIAPTTFVVRVE